MWRKVIRGRYRTPCEKFCTVDKKRKISKSFRLKLMLSWYEKKKNEFF